MAQRIVTAERDAAVREAFQRLRERDQALLRLLVADPAPSYAQIGAILQMPVGSIGPTRARSLTRLRHEAALVGLTGNRRRGATRHRRTTQPHEKELAMRRLTSKAMIAGIVSAAHAVCSPPARTPPHR